MSRYYAEIQGSRGSASRQGSKKSGMWSHTRGWRVGAEVRCEPAGDDRDEVTVKVTGGSGRRNLPEYTRVATFRETDAGVLVVLRHPRTGNVVARHTLER